MRRKSRTRFLSGLGLCTLSACAQLDASDAQGSIQALQGDEPGRRDEPDPAARERPRQLDKLEHLVVIYLENHSFDNLYGSYPGAEGLDSDDAQLPQIDITTDAPYDTLPQLDPNVPLDLSNIPFDITHYVPAQQKTIDLVHRFYQEQSQINGGKMDRF